MSHPTRKRNQAGEGRIGCVLWTLALIFFGYAAWQMVPVKMKAMDLDQFIVRQVERASLQSRNTEQRLRKNILEIADELKIPLEDENLSIRRSGSRVTVKATYTVPIDLIVTTWDWQFKHEIERSIMRI